MKHLLLFFAVVAPFVPDIARAGSTGGLGQITLADKLLVPAFVTLAMFARRLPSTPMEPFVRPLIAFLLIALVSSVSVPLRFPTADPNVAVMGVLRMAKFSGYALLAFAGVAVLVGAFIIYNTFSITVAQRTREFAMLRTIGASRRQILGTVVGEAFIIGSVASIIGIGLGMVFAWGLNKLFDAIGFGLPATGLILSWQTVVVALAVGVGITVLASIFPALRATKIAPIAALREGATLPVGRVDYQVLDSTTEVQLEEQQKGDDAELRQQFVNACAAGKAKSNL